MKRIFGVLTVMMLFCQLGYAQTINDLFDEFEDEEGVDYVNISSTMMRLAKLFMSEEEKEEMEGADVKSIKVLSLEGCSSEVKARFREKAKNLNDKKFELLLKAKNDGTWANIYGIVKDEWVKALAVIAFDENDCALIYLKGTFSLQKIMENPEGIIPEDLISIGD